VFPRYYSRRAKPSDADKVIHVILAGYVVVASIQNGTFETVPYTNRSHLIIVPLKEELELGESELATLKRKEGKKILPKSHPESVRVSGLAKEIIRAAHRSLADDAVANPSKKARQPQTKHLEGINWEVLVVQDDTVNACCMPGGKIVVYTGLLDKFKTDAEIATVLGHEVRRD
jgi:predicted Zn-dependent protease